MVRWATVPTALGLHLTAVPFAVLAAGLVAMALVAALVRGDAVVRLGFAMIALTALPWALTTTLGACAPTSPELVPLFRAGFAPIPLVGGGLLMVMLAVAGRVDDHRHVLIAAIVACSLLALLCAASSTVVAGVQHTDSGLPYPRAGALYGLWVLGIPACVGYGAWATRGIARDRLASATGGRTVLLVIGGLAVLALTDLFLTYGVIDVYPMSWLPSSVAVAVSLHAMVRGDVLRRRGLDRAAVVELAVAGGSFLGMIGLLAVTREPALLAAAVGAVVAAMIALGRSVTLAEARAAPVRDRVVDGLLDALEFAESDDELGAIVRERLGDAGLLTRVRVWFGAGDALVAAGERAPLTLPPTVRGYLLRCDRPVPRTDLATERLGALRPAVTAWFDEVGAAVVVPMCERDQLVGVFAGEAPRGRGLRDAERRQLGDVARAVARAQTVASLRHAIDARTELSREVELADVVRQARSAGGRRTVGGVAVAISYRPAARVAGDLWFTTELPDGRAFVLVGDVAGRGTSAALVSAAVIGACHSATGLATDDVTPTAILTQLHDVVRTIGDGQHRVTATALIIDREDGAPTRRFHLAIAGHRGGYLARPDAELIPLVGRGAPLGDAAWRASALSHELRAGDAVVIVSDGVAAARNREGAAWGERRLQRTLRTPGADGGLGLAEAALTALEDHVGDAPLDDDVLVVALAP